MDWERVIHEGENIKLVAHTYDVGSHGYGGSETSYTLVASNGNKVSLSDEMAEKLMVAFGVEGTVWEVDWKNLRTVKRNNRFVRGYKTKEEAVEAIKAHIDKQIKTLESKRGEIG